MCEWNKSKECCRRVSFAWQAFALALLLLPVMATLANGQLTVTVTIFLTSHIDDDQAVSQTQATQTSGADHLQVQETSQAEVTNLSETQPQTQPPAEEPESDATTNKAPANDDSPLACPGPVETQLSVEPTATLLPADRPGWITHEMDLKSSTHSFVVSSFPTARSNDVDSNLDACLEEATREYVNQLLGDDRAGALLAPHLSSAFVRTNLVDDKTAYVAELSTTGGVMFQKWVQVEVTKEQQEQIRTWYQQQIQRQRMLPLGIGLGGLLGFVSVCNLYFRRSAKKSQQQPVLPMVNQTESNGCCGKRGSWGYAIAIAVAIAVAAVVAN